MGALLSPVDSRVSRTHAQSMCVQLTYGGPAHLRDKTRGLIPSVTGGAREGTKRKSLVSTACVPSGPGKSSPT